MVNRDERQAQRRRQIAEAVWTLAAERGLESVTLRQVADQAGVSMRLVQYYFGTRTELLIACLDLLNSDGEAVAGERVAQLGPSPAARDLARAVLLELLPLDEERRRRYSVHAAYFVRFLVEPGLRRPAVGADGGLEGLVATVLSPEFVSEADARAAADVLVATAIGLQGSVLLGERTGEQATAVLDHALECVLAASAR